MQYSFFRSVFLNAAMPVALASLIWPTQQSPSQARVLSAPPTTVTHTQLSQANGWNSVLHVARLVERNQRSTDLVLQLEVLNKPQTTYANAVYQVFARVRGDSKWQEIYTNRGARLMPGEGGKFVLESEIISITELEDEIRDELGENLRIEDVEIDCVASVRYDLVGGGRDLRETFRYRQSYSEIITTTTTDVVLASTSSTVTSSRTSSSTATVSSRQTSNRHTSRGSDDDDWEEDDDDDDDGWEDDDDDDDDDDDNERSGRHRSNTHRAEDGSTRSSRRTSQRQTQVSQANVWESVLHVARQTSSRQSRNLVLQLEILNKPQTTYANVVYQVFARTRDGRWQEIHTNQGARLIEAASGKYILQSEVISIARLEEELRAELGDDLRLEDVEINCVAGIRYDLAGGRRDIRERFSFQQRYTSIATTTTTTDIIRSSTIAATTSSEVVTLSNGFKISLIDVIYQGGASIWKYRVEELARAQDLSNWVLALPACARVNSYTPRAELVNPDPNAGLYGIKWETGAGFSTGIFSVTIQGEVSVGAIEIAAKGPDVVLGTIAGPVCGGGTTVINDGWDEHDDDEARHHRRRRRNCNQGIGNGPEGCDPGNSRPHGGSNDEGGRRPGRGRNR